MELLNSILYDTVYHSAPIILCVIGGIFAYKANVLNIALEGMMLNGAFVSVLVEYMTGSVAVDRSCNCQICFEDDGTCKYQSAKCQCSRF